jgi:uncharacterized CHY-type Zn-finger protein
MNDNVWYDTNVHKNVRYCGKCRNKVGTNKEKFDFKYCPYCGSHNTKNVPIDSKILFSK